MATLQASSEQAQAAQASSEQAQAAQAGLGLLVAESLQGLVPNFDPTDPESIKTFLVLLEAVIRQNSQASAGLALQAYQEARAGVTGRFNPLPASPPTTDDVQAVLEWSARPLLLEEVDRPTFEQGLIGSAQKSVQDTGRATIINNVHRDPQATGWARIPEPAQTKSGTCSFCAMRAARGAVYKATTASFKAHVHCVCHAEPIFGRYEPSHQIREWQGLWDRSTKGRSGADARAAFRQALEGREITGSKRPGKAGKHAERAEGEPVKLSPEAARRIIAQLEASNRRAAGNPKLEAMVKANLQRIEELRASL